MAWRHFHNHPRLFGATALGTVAACSMPSGWSWPTRVLLGWNLGVWLYLVLTWRLMSQADHGALRRTAQAHGEGAFAVMCAAVGAVAFTLGAIVLELARAKAAQGVAWPQVVLMLATLFGSWLLLATLFALSYASVYYRHEEHPGDGLKFPGTGEDNPPTYLDFIYFSFTMAATSQTSDVAIDAREVRTWALAQAVLSFVFNTVLLALAINTAASLF